MEKYYSYAFRILKTVNAKNRKEALQILNDNLLMAFGDEPFDVEEIGKPVLLR